MLVRVFVYDEEDLLLGVLEDVDEDDLEELRGSLRSGLIAEVD